MKLNKIYCPSCGGTIKGDLSGNTVFCPYCGQQLAIDHEKNEITINHNINIDKHESTHYYDEAKIVEEKTKLEIIKHKDREFWRLLFALLAIFVSFILLVIFLK